MVANDVSAADAGFEVDTNRVVILDAAGGTRSCRCMTKEAVAECLLDLVAQRLG